MKNETKVISITEELRKNKEIFLKLLPNPIDPDVRDVKNMLGIEEAQEYFGSKVEVHYLKIDEEGNYKTVRCFKNEGNCKICQIKSKDGRYKSQQCFLFYALKLDGAISIVKTDKKLFEQILYQAMDHTQKNKKDPVNLLGPDFFHFKINEEAVKPRPPAINYSFEIVEIDQDDIPKIVVDLYNSKPILSKTIPNLTDDEFEKIQKGLGNK
jgi:hypothetical protein